MFTRFPNVHQALTHKTRKLEPTFLKGLDGGMRDVHKTEEHLVKAAECGLSSSTPAIQEENFLHEDAKQARGHPGPKQFDGGEVFVHGFGDPG